jgi:hypothetical protein
MTYFEYKVVPAPRRGLKGKGIKGTPARFANALQLVMNVLGAQGWEYQRTDTLPVEERVGLTKKSTSFQNMLVFRRTLEIEQADAPEVAALIEDQTSVIEAPVAAKPEPEPDTELEDIAAQALDHGSTSEEPNVETMEVIDAPVSLAKEDRVSETITAPFAFPWDKRRTGAQAPKIDDSTVRSEQ